VLAVVNNIVRRFLLERRKYFNVEYKSCDRT
jgi:hypothetical protein